MIVLEIVNPKMDLRKKIDVTAYSRQEMCKIFAVYMSAGFRVYVVQGINELIMSKKVEKCN